MSGVKQLLDDYDGPCHSPETYDMTSIKTHGGAYLSAVPVTTANGLKYTFRPVFSCPIVVKDGVPVLYETLGWLPYRNDAAAIQDDVILSSIFPCLPAS